MENIIIIVIVGILLGCSIGYMIKEKKKGVKCLGCPDGGSCGGSCSCGTEVKQEIE